MLKIGKSFFGVITGLAFLGAALLHGIRAYQGFNLMYGDWLVPVPLSWAVTLVAFILALNAFRTLK